MSIRLEYRSTGRVPQTEPKTCKETPLVQPQGSAHLHRIATNAIRPARVIALRIFLLP
jgi:hypothetical protein